MGSYITGISQAEAFSERLKRELQALEAANVHAILESEPLIDEVQLFFQLIITSLLPVLPCLFVFNRPVISHIILSLDFLPL
jgi:VIT1/CCC1 family predicted Fe2+/Mn2+ transporter